MREQAFGSELVSATEAALALRVCENTLQRWRARSEGPAFVRIGGRVWYQRSKLVEYVEAQTSHCEVA